MTNLKKWKNKIAEAKDSHELVETLHELNRAISHRCSDCVKFDTCNECDAKWLDMEAEE